MYVISFDLYKLSARSTKGEEGGEKKIRRDNRYKEKWETLQHRVPTNVESEHGLDVDTNS